MTAAKRARARRERLLAPRPLQVLRMLSEGRDDGQIAAELHLEVLTVGTYLAEAVRSLGARDRGEAVAVARERGLFGPGGMAIARLKRQQRAALVLIANGATNATIGQQLGLDRNGVNAVLQGAYRILGAGDRAHAVAVAMRLRIITEDEVAIPEPRPCGCRTHRKGVSR